MTSGPGDVPDRDGEGGDTDPFGELFRALMGPGGELPPGLAQLPGVPSDPAALQAMLAQVQQMLAGAGDGSVNWDLATNIARQAAAEGGDPSVGEAAQRAVAEALRTADLWLDRSTELPAAGGRTHAWSRAEWVEQTLGVWKGVVEPVADRVGAAMSDAMATQAPPEIAPMLGAALPMMRRMGGAFFGAQVGQAIGALSREVVGGADVGLPLLPAGAAAMLPTNVTAFGAGLGLPEDEVRLYLALREAAHARLFAGVPWLRAHLLGAVEEYARGIAIDTDQIEAAVRQIDPNDPEALQEALSSGIFEPERTPAQQAALDRLETALALVEGWVDEVVDAAARTSLPHAVALRETVRRRRAAGGPAEHTFASLVGLELRPRRLREAAAVWAALTAARGVAGRDALWAHPDLVPTAESFADPDGFAQPAGASQGEQDLDAALAAILDGADGADGPADPDAPRE
jgi:putative hydrolase